jgi:hypothetical protein
VEEPTKKKAKFKTLSIDTETFSELSKLCSIERRKKSAQIAHLVDKELQRISEERRMLN